MPKITKCEQVTLKSVFLKFIISNFKTQIYPCFNQAVLCKRALLLSGQVTKRSMELKPLYAEWPRREFNIYINSLFK